MKLNMKSLKPTEHKGKMISIFCEKLWIIWKKGLKMRLKLSENSKKYIKTLKNNKKTYIRIRKHLKY